ncbi:MAG: glycosyltransferase family 2 protein [Candidatus Tectimicrobiota bacterium]
MEFAWLVYVLVEEVVGLWHDTCDFFLTLDAAQFVATFWGTLCLDIPRYVCTDILMLGLAVCESRRTRRQPTAALSQPRAQPLVSVIVSALNEEHTILYTLRSLFEQTYPHLEILVVDEGSTDQTSALCQPFAERGQIRLFSYGARMGKSAAVNLGFKFSQGAYIVIIDADSTFDRDAFARLLRYFDDPRVGAVAGNLRVRNRSGGLAVRLQAIEYLLSISMGRRFAAWAHVLNIVSGAFGAFRREVFAAIGGHDVGPGEDADSTLKARKLGVKIAFAHDAICMTEVPATFRQLWRQRLRWERSFVRLRLRKHRNLLYPHWSVFRWSNCLGYLDVFFFQFVRALALPVYLVSLLVSYPHLFLVIMLLTQLGYIGLTLLQFFVALGLSERPAEDARLWPYVLLYSLHHLLFLRPNRLLAVAEELLFRRSYSDPYVPPRVSQRGIRW